MAENYIQLPPNSTGLKAHTFDRTIGANSVHDEVVLLGEQYLASYIVNLGSTVASVATINSHLIQIMAGASLKVRIRRIEVHQHAVATSAALNALQLFRLTTAGTGGTAFTPAPLDSTDSASGATAMTLPTVKGTEGTSVWSGDAYFMQTVAASAQLNEPLLVIDFDRPRSKPLIIPAGTANGIALKTLGAIAAATVLINVWFDETNF